jgi:hypothetical protein
MISILKFTMVMGIKHIIYMNQKKKTVIELNRSILHSLWADAVPQAASNGATATFRVAAPAAGTWRIEQWNSCYRPRSQQVPHTIAVVPGDGSSNVVVYVNQDCDTGWCVNLGVRCISPLNGCFFYY